MISRDSDTDTVTTTDGPHIPAKLEDETMLELEYSMEELSLSDDDKQVVIEHVPLASLTTYS